MHIIQSHKLLMWIFMLVFVSGSLLATEIVTLAQSEFPTPENPTALCVDGTYSSAEIRRFVCHRHSGVAEWLREPLGYERMN